MTDEDALLAAVKERPHDHTPRLVLADWYDDHDMPHEALYHRGVVASRDAANATHAVGEHIAQYYDELSGSTFRRDHQDAADYTSYARRNLNDTNDPEIISGRGILGDAAYMHMNAASVHRDAAYTAAKRGDHTLANLHRDAAVAHDKAHGFLRAIGGHRGDDEYRERVSPTKKTRRKVDITGVHAVPGEDGRVGIQLRYHTVHPVTSHLSETRFLHPTDFHRLHEPVTK